jgi:hypothetical protein
MIRLISLTLILLLLTACSVADVLPTSNPTSTVESTPTSTVESTPTPSTTNEPSDDSIIANLFDTKQSDVQVHGSGTVTRLLADDSDGDRHQRFIVELESGQTLLIAHNIDIAPRLDDLAVGDTVEFCGEYYYNEDGGGVHWTHSDPDGSHVSGWLKYNGATYN